LDVNDGNRLRFDCILTSTENCAGIDNRSNNVWISRTSTNMPGQGRFHLIDGRMEILVEKAFGGDDPAGCAEAAICGYTGVPDTLERMEIFLIPYSFDRENPLACGFGRQRMARVQRNAFNQDTTRAATSPVAASVRSSETQLDC